MPAAESFQIIGTSLAIAFGMWAGVVAWIGHGIRTDLKDINAELRQESRNLNRYIVQTESRLAVIEDRLEINHER